MTQANLGSKRQCPKCAAKFYDFGAVNPITCPKCGKTWKEEAAKPAKVVKAKKEPVKAAPKRRLEDDLDDVALPDVEGDDIEEIEPVEDEEVELTSLEEVEEHEEEAESDPNSDDADDDMFTEMVGGEKLVDDLEDHMDDEDDEDDDEDDEDDEDEDEDDEDDTPKRRR